MAAEAIKVDFRGALLMFARALDYVGIDDRNHGHRVAYNAYRAAERLGWATEKVQFAYCAGLIHDCGVFSSKEHLRLIAQLKPEGAEAHCLRGYSALQNCTPLRQYATAVRYHHTPWYELNSLDLEPFDRDIAALVFMADRIDFLRARYIHDTHQEFITLKEDLIIDNIQAHKGRLFRDDIAQAFIELVGTDGFWFNMESEYIESLIQHFGPASEYERPLPVSEVIEMSQLLANIVDAKSPFTYQHSHRVGDLAVLLAEYCQLDAEICEQIYIAGLLHDVGKLRTADEILNKQGPLTPEEGSFMRRHVVDTANTLAHFFPGSKISQWASNHHEKLDGSGYPNRLYADELDLPSRIIAIVDIFQALSQHRPYRGRLEPGEVMGYVRDQVDKQQLDADLFEIILANIDEFYRVSVEGREPSQA